MRSSLLATVSAAGLLLAAAVACTRDPSPPGVRVVDRLIAEEPVGAFEQGVAGPREPLVEWTFRRLADRRAWQLVEGEEWEEDKGLPLRSGLVRIRTSEPISTADAESLRIDLSFPRRCGARVHWKDAEPVVQGPPASPAMTLRVDLTRSPDWDGTAEALSLTLRNCRGGHLVGLALEGRSEHVDETFTEAWKVTLARDTRSGVLVAPGTERRWSLAETARSARLRLAVGATDRPESTLRWTVAVAADDQESILREVTLAPATWEEDPGWREVDLELPRLAAGDEIVLRATSDRPWRPGDAVPVFAEPRILAGRDDPRPNVLLVSVDTLRADHLSLYGHDRDTSPNLDRRARSSGVTFTSVVAPGAWTLPSHVSMLSGLDAVRHGVNHETTATPRDLQLVSETFRDAGYETVAFTAGGYVSPEFGFSRGFESFRARRPQKRSVAASREELRHGLDQITRWLADPPEQPFFAFFHTYEVHAPFWARKPYFERFGGRPEDAPRGYAFTTNDRDRNERVFVIPGRDGEPLPDPDPEVIARLYDSGIAYMDAQLERLFETLESSGLLDDTIVVVTSDHGESLGEHGLAGHGPAYDQVIMVPLVLWVPGLDAGRRLEQQVRLVDVPPTLLDLADLEIPADIDGQSLRPLWEGRPGYESRPGWIHAGRFGVAMRVADRMKYIWHRVPWDHFGPGEELFDLRDDPRESRDLAGDDLELLASARDRTRAWLLENLPGLRVRLQNSSTRDYEIVLDSDENRPSGVTDFGCADLAWRPARSVVVRIEPGGDCTLALEHVRASELTIEGRARAPSSAAAVLTLDTAELTRATTRTLSGGSWEPADGVGGEGVTLRVEWLREPAAPAEGDVRIDEALAEQLRALGYLD